MNNINRYKENYCQCDNPKSVNYLDKTIIISPQKYINSFSNNTVPKQPTNPCNISQGSPGFSNIGVL